MRMCATTYTHDAAVLAQLDQLVTINSALEVDLTGQVNAEQSGSAYLGGTGGQVDFVRAGARSRGGRSIIALSATAKRSEEHTSELQSLMRHSYAVFCLKKKTKNN